MTRSVTAALVIGAALGLSLAAAHAGPCSKEIAEFQEAVRHSGKNADAGPTAPQSIGAQLGHQPTPSSVGRAEDRAEATFAAALSRATALDAEGKRAECLQALAEARAMFDSQ